MIRATILEKSRGPRERIDFGGIGVKRNLTKSIGFRADAGVVLTKVPTFGLPESSAAANATVLPVGGLVRNVRGSVGLIFYLGR